ncbi:hypothetical protein G5B39_12055 [Rhodobacteraceae bacterium SC52]|nr:hypothetical protein G5B39_12055 [Rhodobacteraceae bacterium SC52]
MELYNRACRACHVEGMSQSDAARAFGVDRKTVAKLLKHSVPTGYRRSKPPVRPTLDRFVPVIDQILEIDKGRLKKQRHTAKRVFDRLRCGHAPRRLPNTSLWGLFHRFSDPFCSGIVI